MPVISIPRKSKWSSASFTADFTDDNFGFLGTFEEITPTECRKVGRKNTSKKPRRGNNETSGGDVKDSGLHRNTEEVELQIKRKKGEKRKVSQNPGVSKEKMLKSVENPTNIDVASDEDLEESLKESKDVGKAQDNQDEENPVRTNWKEFFLPQEVVDAINDMGFITPTEIQKLVLPSAVRDRLDILGAAETGSGKTLAYAIPVVARLLSEERRGHGPRAVVLAPTRELVIQIMKQFNILLKYAKFEAIQIVGGLAQVKQERILRDRCPEIIIATPGRLWAMMKDAEEMSYFGSMAGLCCLVVDETDRMAEKGHFVEMAYILKKIRSSASEKLQTLVFSATLTFVHREQSRDQQKEEQTPEMKLKELISLTGLRPQHKVFDITRKFGTSESLVETRINCSNLLEKDTSVMYLLERYKGRTLIFTNSVDASRRLYGIIKLLKSQPMVFMIHAKMDQKRRLKNLENFAKQDSSVLLATDVAARGLDILGIEHVIHYQVPRTAETYIHRSGRTARACQMGLTVLMVDTKDAHLYRRLCKNLNRDNDLPVFPIDSLVLMKSLKQRVKLASELDNLSYRFKKICMNENWFTRTIREAEMEMDGERRHEQDLSNGEMNAIKTKQLRLEMELRAELALALPKFDKVEVPKTRYINPEIFANYNKSTSRSALDSLQIKLNEGEALKKRTRHSIKTHQLKQKKYKK